MRALPAAICCALLLLCGPLAWCAAPPAFAVPRRLLFRPGEPGPRALLVVLPPASWTDLRQPGRLPTIDRLAAEGGVGLMPVSTSWASGLGPTWVTLSAGAPAVGARELPDIEPSSAGPRIDLGPARAANERARTGATPGLLGQRLHDLALTTAVFAAFGDGRAAAIALADERGTVDAHWHPPDPPGAAPRHALRDSLLEHATVLLDLSAAPSLPAADRLLGDALDSLPGRSLVIILAPAASRTASEPWGLGAVVLAKHPSGGTAGLLTSPATRRRGLVTAADIAPTILRWWTGAADPIGGIAGRPIEVIPSPRAPAEIDRLGSMLATRDRLRVAAGSTYAAYMVALAVAALLLACWRPAALRGLGAPALVGALLPGALLLAPLAGRRDSAQLALAGAAAILCALAAARLPSARHALAAAMLLGVALIAADAAAGSPLMFRSPLGFGVISGSRFYGIGNEYLGVLAAMAPIGIGALLQLRPGASKMLGALGILLVLLVGAPWWGANWGGSIALAAGLIALWIIAARVRPAKAVVVVALALIASALAPAALDLLRPAAARSHIGIAAAALFSGDIAAIGDTAVRKMTMNWRLLSEGARFWYGPLLGLAGFWAMLRPAGPARVALQELPLVSAGLIGAAVSGAVALIVNDSGVVSAAIAGAVILGVLIFLSARAPEAAP